MCTGGENLVFCISTSEKRGQSAKQYARHTYADLKMTHASAHTTQDSVAADFPQGTQYRAPLSDNSVLVLDRAFIFHGLVISQSHKITERSAYAETEGATILTQ